jgi:hypothetical protein
VKRERITKETFSDYKDRVRKFTKSIGEGAYAEVFKHPKIPDVVVKIFDSKEDQAYDRYLRWCVSNQKNPYVPKIHAVDRFKCRGSYYAQEITIVFMEKLKKLNSTQIDKKAKQIIPKSVFHYGDIYDLRRNDWMKVAEVARDPNLKKFARFISSSHDCFDFHDGNIMTRKDGQLVFTDPLA